MEFDEVFQYIGEFKLYQFLYYMLLGIVSFIGGYQAIAITFLAGGQEHWCDIEKLNQFPFEQQKYVGIPYDETEDEYSSCEYYDLPYDNLTYDDIVNWNWTTVNRNVTTIECEGWVFDKSEFVNTIVNKYDLVCDRSNLVPFLNTLYALGILFGALLSGFVGDRFGRKTVLIAGNFIYIVVAILGAYAPNYPLFGILRLLLSCFSSAAYLASFVMIMEIIGPKYRAVAGVVNMIWFAIGFMVLPGMAYYVRDDTNLQLCMAVPVVVTTVFIFLIPESPRWLIAQKRYSEAEKIVRNIAAVNNRELPEKLDFSQVETKSPEPEEKGKFTDLFTHPIIRREILVIYLGWFTNSLVYYGLSLNTGSLVGSVFVNTFISGFVEVPANFACLASMYFLGRKPTMIWSFLLAGITSFLCVPFLENEDLGWLVTTFTMIGKAGITSSFSAIYIYSSELFPTPVRHLALGSSSVMARIGGIIAPYMGESLMNVWVPMPSVIFGITGIISGAAMFLLPETLNKKMPDTIAEAEELGRIGKKNNKDSKMNNDMDEKASDGVTNYGYDTTDIMDSTKL